MTLDTFKIIIAACSFGALIIVMGMHLLSILKEQKLNTKP